MLARVRYVHGRTSSWTATVDSPTSVEISRLDVQDRPASRPLERILMMAAVYDGLAGDAPALAACEERVAGPAWIRFVRGLGGEPHGVPALRREPNPRYGLPRSYSNGDPVLDEDGAPVLDRVLFTIVATGYAVRGTVSMDSATGTATIAAIRRPRLVM